MHWSACCFCDSNIGCFFQVIYRRCWKFPPPICRHCQAVQHCRPEILLLNDRHFHLNVWFQLSKCLRVVTRNLVVQWPPQVEVIGEQIWRSWSPQALVHHMISLKYTCVCANALDNVWDAAPSCWQYTGHSTVMCNGKSVAVVVA